MSSSIDRSRTASRLARAHRTRELVEIEDALFEPTMIAGDHGLRQAITPRIIVAAQLDEERIDPLPRRATEGVGELLPLFQ